MIDYGNAPMGEKLKCLSDEARRAYNAITRGQCENGSYSESAGTDAKWTLANLADLLLDLFYECENRG